MKRITLLSLVVLLVVSMTFLGLGCKGTAAETTVETETAIETETTVETETTATESTEPVTIELSGWQVVESGIDNYFIEFKEAFEKKYPYITINLTGAAPTDYNTKLLARISAGDAPDIFQLRPTMVAQLVEAGALYNIKPYLDQKSWAEDLLAAQSVVERKDGTYGVVFTATPQVMLYNKGLLKEGGIDQVPSTPEELLAAAEQIYKKTGAFGVAVSSDPTSVLDMHIEFMKQTYGFGGAPAKNGEVTIYSPENIEAVKFWKTLWDSDFAPKGGISTNIRQMMWERKVAMYVDGSWSFSGIKANNPTVYEEISVALPAYPTHATIVGGAVYGIPSTTKNIDAVYKALDMLYTDEWQENYVYLTSQTPGLSGRIPTDFLADHPWMELYNDVSSTSVGSGYIPEGFDLVAEEWQQIEVEYLVKILTENAPIEETLKELQDIMVEKFADKAIIR